MLRWLSTTDTALLLLERRRSRPESAFKLLLYLVAMASTAAILAMAGIQLIRAFVI